MAFKKVFLLFGVVNGLNLQPGSDLSETEESLLDEHHEVTMEETGVCVPEQEPKLFEHQLAKYHNEKSGWRYRLAKVLEAKYTELVIGCGRITGSR